jgi:hypothetical protein
MEDSSIVSMLLRTANDCRQMKSKKAPLHSTLSCFWSVDNSLGTQRLFYQTQIVSQDGLNGPKHQVMHGGSFMNSFCWSTSMEAAIDARFLKTFLLSFMIYLLIFTAFSGIFNTYL